MAGILFPTRRFKIWILLGVILALYIEFDLDTPGIRDEWWVNGPFISVAAATLVILWSTLLHLTRLRLDVDGIGRSSREFRAKVLRPWLIGMLALCVVTAWLIGYSAVILPLGTAEHIREAMQIVFCGVTLLLLASLGVGLWRKLGRLPADVQWRIKPEEEEALNFGRWGLVDSIFPNFDENMRKAMLLAVVPFASIIGSLFG